MRTSSSADAAAAGGSDETTGNSSSRGRGGIAGVILRGRSHGTVSADDRSVGGESDGDGDASVSSVCVRMTSLGAGAVGRSATISIASEEAGDGGSVVDPPARATGDGSYEGGLLGAASTPKKAEAAQASTSADGFGATSAAEAQLLPLDDDDGSCHTTPPPAASAAQAPPGGPQAPPEKASFFGVAAGDKRRGTTRSSVFRTKIGGGGSSGGTSSSIFRRGKATDAAASKPENASGAANEHGDDDDDGESSSESDRSCHPPQHDIEEMSVDTAAPAAQAADLVNMLMMSSPSRGQKRASAKASAKAAARRSKARRGEGAAKVSDDEEGDVATSTGVAEFAATIDQKQDDEDEKKKSGPVDVDDVLDISSSDEEAFQTTRKAMTYSKYDYDMNWDMIGHKKSLEDEDDDAADASAGKEEDTAAEANSTGSIDVAGRSIASGSADTGDVGAPSAAVDDTSAIDTSAAATAPSVPLPPRRRTRSSPGGTIASMTYALAVPARTRRQYYAYQSRNMLDDESDVDVDHNDSGFDDVRNRDDGEAGDGETEGGGSGGQSLSPGFFDEFDDFVGSPVVPHSAAANQADATSEAGNDSIHTADGAEGGASVSTGSSSSSSSMRRRAHFASTGRSASPSFGPGAVSVGIGAGAAAGQHIAPSVSSFTASTSSMPTGPASRPSSRRRLNPRAAARTGRRRRQGGGSSTRAAEGSGDSSSGGGGGAAAAASNRVPPPASSSSALRNSLDAGMAAMRRWARSRPVATAVPNVGTGPRPSRAVSSQLMLGEEDIFALSNAGSRDLHRHVEVGSLGLTRSQDFDEEFRHDVYGMGRMYPPPIAEEEDEAGVSGGNPGGRRGLLRGLRQRAFSEPDQAGVVRDLFSSMGRAGGGGGWRRRGNGQLSDGNESRRGSRSQPASPLARRQQSDGSNDRTSRRRGQRQRHIFRRQRHASSDDDSSRDADAVDRSITAAGRSASFVSSNDAGSSSRSTNAPLAPPYLSSTALSASSLFQSPEHAPPAGSHDNLDLLESGRAIGGVGAAPRSQMRPGHSGDEGLSTEEPGGGRGENTDVEFGDEEAGETLDGGAGTAGAPQTDGDGAGRDPNREARGRWIRINRRFQLIITVVALIFSMLLFAILVCWVVLTSAYVVSIDKVCDVPLKTYFWLATLQLIMDVFRTDIIRFVFRWDTNSRQRMPMRVIVYNVAYLVYAIMVLRMGLISVFATEGSTCPRTAPELFQTSMVFVILSLTAWSTIVIGYLGPFCFVACILTRNGYSPSADIDGSSVGTGGPIPGVGGVFPATYAGNAAPTGTVDRLRVVLLDEFPEEYPKECCICMGDFTTGEIIVATECEHVFHKRCCQEWLRQARTCPVCRTDIPNSLPERDSDDEEMQDEESYGGRDYNEPPSRPPLNREEFHQEVVNLLRILRRHEERLRDRLNTPQSGGNGVELRNRRGNIPSRVTDEAESNAERRRNAQA